MLAPEANQQIEQLLAANGVVGKVRRLIEAEVAEDAAIRARLKFFGLTTEADYNDLLKRVRNARISYRERVLQSWDEIRDAVGQTEHLTMKLHFEGTHGVLLLIDPYPGANWAHPCWIATFDVDNRNVRTTLNDFPPFETADRRLVPFVPSETCE